MPYAFLDTQYIDLPAGTDEAYLRGLVMRSGLDFPTILRTLDAGLGALNTTVDPLVAALAYLTTEIMADSSAATAFEINEAAEYTVARPQIAEGGATMLPLRRYDVSLALTEEGMETISLAQFQVQVNSMLLGWRRLYRRKILERLFSDIEMRIDTRSATTSPGFAGSGTGANVFATTSYPDGTAIGAGYTHYFRITTATLAAGLMTAVQFLRRWHVGPFDLVAPQSLIDQIVMINPGNPATGFVSAGSTLVRQGNGIAEAMVDPTMYLGVLFGDVRVHMAINDFASANIAIYKSYGPLDARNPLAWRYDALRGRDVVVRSRSLFPLDQAIAHQSFGIGVNNRVGAVLISVAASGAYTPPTFS